MARRHAALERPGAAEASRGPRRATATPSYGPQVEARSPTLVLPTVPSGRLRGSPLQVPSRVVSRLRLASRETGIKTNVKPKLTAARRSRAMGHRRGLRSAARHSGSSPALLQGGVA